MRLEHSGLYSFEFYQNGRLTGLISVELLGFTPLNPKPTIEVSIYEKQGGGALSEGLAEWPKCKTVGSRLHSAANRCEAIWVASQHSTFINQL